MSSVREASELSRHIYSKDPDSEIKITKGESLQRISRQAQNSDSAVQYLILKPQWKH